MDCRHDLPWRAPMHQCSRSVAWTCLKWSRMRERAPGSAQRISQRPNAAQRTPPATKQDAIPLRNISIGMASTVLNACRFACKSAERGGLASIVVDR